VDQLSEGEGFDKLRETIGIHFLDFSYFPGDQYVRQFIYRDSETGEYFDELEHHRLYFVEMRKFRKEWNELSTGLDRWISFMNRAESLSRGAIPSELAVDTAIVKAVEQLERIGFNSDERELYERKVQGKMVDAATLQFEAHNAKEQLLFRQITKKFGPRPGSLANRLRRLTAEHLDELGEVILDLDDPAELDKWITSRLPA